MHYMETDEVPDIRGKHVWTYRGQIRECGRCNDRETYWDDEAYPVNPCLPLNRVMEFDRVIQVHVDEFVTSADVLAPELHTEPDGDSGATEYLESPHGTSWKLLSGYTGQYGYNGPVMHPSEFIGGRMETDILNRPGYYVALIAEDPDDDYDEPMGWVVAYRPS